MTPPAAVAGDLPRRAYEESETRTRNTETEFVGILVEEALEERRFTGARWAADHQWTQRVDGRHSQ